uniref:DNA-directed RNA polymerase III subunit RPC6 n=1 Tax=Lygus hesperus TaxID=30085 RepID=A0A0A9VYQ6_LYGHE
MLIGLLLSLTIVTTATRSRRIKESASSSTTLENLLLELVSAYENGIRNEGISQPRPSKVFQRRNISLPSDESHTLKYSFSIRGSLDNLKSPVIHLYKTKNKKLEGSNRTETARYKLLTKRTNEEFISYLDRLIEEKNSALRDTEEKIMAVKRKIGKARLSYEQKIFQRPKDTADLVTKLTKKEGMLRSQLTERLNTYLAAASSLILPPSAYPVPLSSQLSDPNLFHMKSRSVQVPGRWRFGRSVDAVGSHRKDPFLQKKDLEEITSMIWEGTAIEKPPKASEIFSLSRKPSVALHRIERRRPIRMKSCKKKSKRPKPMTVE